MKTTVNKIILTCVFASTLSMSAYASITEKVSKSFDVDANSHFSLNNINGEVEISSWSDSVIKVEATIDADNQEGVDRVNIKMDQNDNEVSVETDYEDSSNWKNNHSAKVSYKVWLPAETKLSNIELVNGSLLIENVSGEVKAEVVNGSIKATGLTENSEISSVNGSVKVYYQAISSNLKDIDIETVNGSIKLYVPSEIDATLDLETMHGSIRTEFGLRSEDNTFTGKHLRGEIGTGEVEINMESVNGTIKVLKN